MASEPSLSPAGGAGRVSPAGSAGRTSPTAHLSPGGHALPTAAIATVFFEWTRAGERVFVTGSFCKWGKGVEMRQTVSGFMASIHVPELSRLTYRYVVDGVTRVDETANVEVDADGNKVNWVVASKSQGLARKVGAAPKPEAERATTMEQAFVDAVADMTATTAYVADALYSVAATIAESVGMEPAAAEVPVAEEPAPAPTVEESSPEAVDFVEVLEVPGPEQPLVLRETEPAQAELEPAPEQTLPEGLLVVEAAAEAAEPALAEGPAPALDPAPALEASAPATTAELSKKPCCCVVA
jgi:hypothetical protein